jgi:hypothetical protein
MFWPPGDDPAGRRLKLEAEKVRVAVLAFRSERGREPISIAELIPEKLSVPPPVEVRYRVRNGIPVLEIDYTNSWPSMGRSDCALDIDSGVWRCQGYI